MIYEIMYIIPSKFSDSEIDGIIERVATMLEKSGAKIQESQNLGKLKLAYPIKKIRHGTYVLLYVDGEELDLKKIDQDFRLSDDVLRHMVIKRPDGLPSAKFRFRPTSYQEPLTSEGKRTTRQIPRKPKAQEPAEPLSTEELDKKLDKILETDISNI